MSIVASSNASENEFKVRINRLDSSLGAADVRRGDITDIEAIQKLTCPLTFELFGDVNVAEIVDKSLMTVCLENSDDDIVAVICLSDYPNIPAIPPWEWTNWLYKVYQLESITSRNTFWIKLAVWDFRYTFYFMRPILTAIYETSNMLEYIILALPPNVTNISWLQFLGTRIIPSGYSEPNKVQTLFLTVRQHFIRRYKIRRAVEEDNDDLVPLIHSNSDRLVSNYGEFYIAEILTRHPDDGRTIIVAEYSEHAVAVLCMNEAVNIEVLTNSFELTTFYGLRKPHHLDDYGDICGRLSATTLLPDEILEEPDLTPLEMLKPEEEESVSVEEPVEIEPHQMPSQDSEDDISLVDISSIHYLFSESEEESTIDDKSQSDYSAIVLSFNDYEMHLFADRADLKSRSFTDYDVLSNKPIRAHGAMDKNKMYHGSLNAFTLELAVSQFEYELEALSLLLEAAFECYPDLDYCVLTVPSTCPYTPLFKHFVKVPPKPYSSYRQELYVLHRNTILSVISVREAERLDFAEIEKMVSTIDNTRSFIESFDDAIHKNLIEEARAYILLSESQVVGVAIAAREDDYEYIKNNYELQHWFDENFHNPLNQGSLAFYIISPIFQRHARFFLREIHRLTDYSVLYYRLYPLDINSYSRNRSLCCALSDLVSTVPRIKPEFTQSCMSGCAPESHIYETQEPFALYVSTARLGTIERYHVNRKIVVVGSSDTAISFLLALVCGSENTYRVTFNNVTVVSPHGLNYQHSENAARDMMFVTKSNYNYHTMHLYALRTFVNVVNGVMTGINRKDKYLVINNNSYLHYDYLFLLCGEQFQKPTFLSVPCYTIKEKPQTQFPGNVFLINTEFDATSALNKLKTIISNAGRKYNVVVFGNAMETYCCLAALLEFGVSGKHITFIESFPVKVPNKHIHTVSLFNDGEVDDAVMNAIIQEYITVYSSYYFVDWNVDEDTHYVTSAIFHSRHKEITVELDAMFMYNQKSVSSRTFLAVNQAGLVFDGSLVIKSDCRTNDPNIYAAGTITKYSRRYYADHLSHKYFNLEEIGTKLAQYMRKKLIPFEEGESPDIFQCENEDMIVQTYVKPQVTYCRLPGKLTYLYITKPGQQIPLETAMSSDDYGQVLVTGDSKALDKQGYFRLHLNNLGSVETITCLAKFDIDRINLTRAWGKHEKLLNNLLMRFEMLMITDLFEYFREPWTCAIYHDRFSSFEKELREIVTSLTIVPKDTLLDDVFEMFRENNYSKLTMEQTEKIEEKFLGSTFHQKIEKGILQFLKANASFLTMYAHPTLVSDILKGNENSPLFFTQ